MIFHLTPIAKPRMTHADRWRKRPGVLRYRAFCDELRLQALKEDYRLPETFSAVFYLPMPKSWSTRHKLEMAGCPHQQRPDLDNLLKSVMDAFLVEDKAVWKITAEKRWGRFGMIEIEET